MVSAVIPAGMYHQDMPAVIPAVTPQPPPGPRVAPARAAVFNECKAMANYTELIQSILVAIVTGAAGYILAAFKKASRADLSDLETRIEAKLRERQAFIIDPLKAQLTMIEAKLADCITVRELDAKFTALERRLDDIVALIARRSE